VSKKETVEASTDSESDEELVESDLSTFDSISIPFAVVPETVTTEEPTEIKTVIETFMEATSDEEVIEATSDEEVIEATSDVEVFETISEEVIEVTSDEEADALEWMRHITTIENYKANHLGTRQLADIAARRTWSENYLQYRAEAE